MPVMAALVLLARACGPVVTRRHRKRAGELAEALYPGRLRVIGARPLFPQAGGSEIAFAVTGDPDAVVRLRVDAGAGSCGGQPCDRALARALREARTAAEDLRALSAALGRCGYEVYAVGSARSAVGEPWIAAALTDDTVTDVLGEIGACLRRWSLDRPAPEGSPVPRGTTVNVVAPEAVRDLPAGPSRWPTLMRLTHPRLPAALSRRPYHAVHYAWRDGAVDPASATVRIVRPFAQRQRFDAAVRANVASWLGSAVPGAVVVEGYGGVWRLVPGRVDRLSGHVLFCAPEDPHARGRRCPGCHAVAVTVGPDGALAGEPVVVRGVREGDGSLRLPPP